MIAIAEGLATNWQLTDLNLDYNGITDKGLSALAKQLHNLQVLSFKLEFTHTNQQSLSLSNNKILGAGVIDLADSLLDDNSSLTRSVDISASLLIN